MNLFSFLNRRARWSNETFGRTVNPAKMVSGILEHIRSEVKEIEIDPFDITETVDLILLAFELANRAGHTPHDLIKAIQAKQVINESRTWLPFVEAMRARHVEPHKGEFDPFKNAKPGDICEVRP